MPACIPLRKEATAMQNKTTLSAILQILKSYLLLSISVLLVIASAVGVSLLPPLILADIVDGLTSGEPLQFNSVLLYFLAIALSGLLTSARESLLIVLGQKITHALRSEILQKMNRLDTQSLSRLEPGAFTARFSGDVDTVQQLFTSGIISMFADACRIISIFILILCRSTGLALVLCLVMPLIFFFTRMVQNSMLSAQLGYRKAVSRVSNHVPESIRCIRTIHTLQKESYMKQRYDDYISQAYEAMEKSNFFDSVYSPVILVTNAVVVAVVMVLSSSGNSSVLDFFGMSVGTAVALINYISQIFGPIESLGMEIQTIQSAVAGVHRIDEFLSMEERPKTEAHPQFDERQGVLLKNVDFAYDSSTKVLNNVSFSVEQGENVTLEGRTGAGKSTLFKLLLGMYRAQKGVVNVFGVDAGSIHDDEKRRIFGYVEQSFRMIPGTVMEQITLKDPMITDAMAERAACLTGLSETIERLENGYDTVCEPGIFSQGQWQLLSIARAVAADPKLLLLDEITANLDSETEKNVIHALNRASEGRTVISISHRIYDRSGGRLIHIGNEFSSNQCFSDHNNI